MDAVQVDSGHVIYGISAFCIAAAVALAIIHPTPPRSPAMRAAPPNESVAMKSNPEPLILAHPVRTIAISPITAPAVAPVAIVAPIAQPSPAADAMAPALPVAAKPKHAPSDVCGRHGGRRVDEGRKWRCEFPKAANRPPKRLGRVRLPGAIYA